MMPRIFRPDPKQLLFYAMGYGGNGVMYSAQAGRRMAQMVAGKGGALDLPILRRRYRAMARSHRSDASASGACIAGTISKTRSCNRARVKTFVRLRAAD